MKGRPAGSGDCFLGWHRGAERGSPASSREGGQSQHGSGVLPVRDPKRGRILRGEQSEPCTPTCQGWHPGAGAMRFAAAPPFSWAPRLSAALGPPPPEWACVCPAPARQPQSTPWTEKAPLGPHFDQFAGLSPLPVLLGSEVPVLLAVTGTMEDSLPVTAFFSYTFLSSPEAPVFHTHTSQARSLPWDLCVQV